MTRPPARSSPNEKYQWEQIQRRFKAQCRMRNSLCHLCILRGDIENALIDYSAKPLNPNAFEADHIRPRATHPELRFVWNNLAPSHSRCNRQRRDLSLTEYAALFGISVDPDPNVIARQPDWVKPDW